MSNFNLTPNMGLPNPVPGVDPGPDYAQNLQTSNNIVDAHNHSSGSGVQINPNGININSALPFNGNPATLLGYLGISPQGTGVATPINDSLYCSGVDLYFQDGNGNAVRITSGGTVNATSSGISSGTALATFVSSILVVTQSTGVGAAIDAATYILRYNGSYPSPSGNYILLSAPSSLATGYQITFPATTPASSGALYTMSTAGVLSYTNVDGSTLTISGGVIQVGALGITATQIANGTITATQIANATITSAQIAASTYQKSSSCGTFSTASASFVAVTNLSCTITTVSIRPVYVFCVAAASGSNSLLRSGTGSGVETLTWKIRRDGTTIAIGNLANNVGTSTLDWPVSAIAGVDDGQSAESHTYDVQVEAQSGRGIVVSSAQLVAWQPNA